MGRKYIFDDYLDSYSMDAKKRILNALDYILDNESMSMRRISRELCIPRRTLGRYCDDYIKRIAGECFDYNEFKEEIDYFDLYYQLEAQMKRRRLRSKGTAYKGGGVLKCIKTKRMKTSGKKSRK